MTRIPVEWPFKGLSDNLAFGKQEPDTTRASRNVRSLDPKNARLRGAQRPGSSKFQPGGTSAGAVGTEPVKHTGQFTLGSKQVDYVVLDAVSAEPPGTGEMWQEVTASVPSGGQCYDLEVDDQENVYALDGNAGVAKLSSDLELVWNVACPQADGEHVNRVLVLDEFGGVYAAVTEGGDHKNSRIWCVEPDPEFLNVRELDGPRDEGRLRWQLQMDDEGANGILYGHGHIGDMKVNDGRLYTAQNDPTQLRSWVVIYTDIDTANPRRETDFEAPYPIHNLAVYKNGEVVISCPPEANRGTNPLYPDTPNVAFPGSTWTPERDLTDYESRVWARFSTTDMLADGSDPLDSYEDPETGEDVLLRWIDSSGNERHLFRDATDSPPIIVQGGWGGKRALEFRGSESLVSLANTLIEKAYRSSQKSIIPGYEGASFCVFMVVEMTPAAEAHCWLYQDNEIAGAGGALVGLNAIVANRREAAAANNPVEGLVSIFEETTADANGPAAGDPFHACFDTDCTGVVASGGTETKRAPVGGIISYYNNGGLASAPKSFFRFNGCPFDRWDSLGFESTAATELGKNSAVTQWNEIDGGTNAIGRIYEILVLDRRDHDDDSAELIEEPGYPTLTSGASHGVGFIEIVDGGSGWGASASGALSWTGGGTGTWYADGPGVIRRLTITAPGTGLTTQPTITATGTGSGSETLTAYLHDPSSATEVELIEGSYAHKMGAQHVLDDDSYAKYVLYGSGLVAAQLQAIGTGADTHGSNSAFEHPYHTSAPASTGSVDVGLLNETTYGLIVKYGAEEARPVKWIVGPADGATGSAVKGIGYAMELIERREDAAPTFQGSLYVEGPGVGGTGNHFQTILDEFDSASVTTPSGNYHSDDVANPYARTASNPLLPQVYVPYMLDSATAGKSVRFTRASGFWQESVTAGENQSGYAVAVSQNIPLAKKHHDGTWTFYDRETLVLGSERTVHMYVALSIADDEFRVAGTGSRTTLPAISKVRLISEQANDKPPRKVCHVAISDATFYRLRIGTAWPTSQDADWGEPGGGGANTTALAENDSDTTFFDGVAFNEKYYICDGGGTIEDEDRGGILVYDVGVTKTGAFSDRLKPLNAQYGQVPQGVRGLTSWGGRLVAWSGAHWYMSGVGNARDWDYFPPVVTASSAISGALTVVGPGEVPDIINTVIAYDADTLIFGCDHHAYLLRGNPRQGGQIDLIAGGDDQAAPLGMSFGPCWCKNRVGILYFTDNNGTFYRMVPGGNPEDLSESKIARRLREVDLTSYYFKLVYSYDEKGVRIFQIPFNGDGEAGRKSWFFSERTGGFDEDTYGATTIQPASASVVDGDDPDDRVTVLGCDDGYVRFIDKSSDTDDGTTIDSYQTWGPFLFGGPGNYSRTISASVALADDRTSGANLELFVTNKADRFPDAPTKSVTLDRGVNHVDLRGAGIYLYVRLRNIDSGSWAFEWMEIEGYEGGDRRGA